MEISNILVAFPIRTNNLKETKISFANEKSFPRKLAYRQADRPSRV